MEYSINIEDLYKKIFGINRTIYVPIPSSASSIGESSQFNPGKEAQFAYKAGSYVLGNSGTIELAGGFDGEKAFGSLVVDTVKFLGGSYQVRLTDGSLQQVNYDSVILPATTTLEISRRKNVIKTPRNGGAGTVKELVQFEDYQVRIRGVLVAANIEELHKQIKVLRNLDDVPSEVGVVCEYLRVFGIDALEIESITYPEVKGSQFMQPFEIECYSDQPLNNLSIGL